MLYFDGKDWLEICRIDNYAHENKAESHIHSYQKKEIKKIKLSLEEAEKMIKEVSEKVLKDKFNKIIKFGR